MTTNINKQDNNSDNNTDFDLELCIICCEEFNEPYNKKIYCNECKSKICLNCVKKHLKENGIVFSCPCCKTPWDLFTNDFY